MCAMKVLLLLLLSIEWFSTRPPIAPVSGPKYRFEWLECTAWAGCTKPAYHDEQWNFMIYIRTNRRQQQCPYTSRSDGINEIMCHIKLITIDKIHIVSCSCVQIWPGRKLTNKTLRLQSNFIVESITIGKWENYLSILKAFIRCTMDIVCVRFRIQALYR